ncbi:MAG: hypothetical protein GY930_08145 [bacterium]|nr:hypothetical protein [bacterium]
MLHFVRLLFLTLGLCVAGFIWAYGSHPEWVQAADRRLCDRHVYDTQVIWDRVQEAVEQGGPDGKTLHADVNAHLRSLGEVRFGERRFSLWRDLVVWYVAEARKWGELDVAIVWQGRLVELAPRDVQQGLIHIELLMEKGRPKNLKNARESLTSIRLALPAWEPAQQLDFRLALIEQDWELALEVTQDLQAAGGKGLAQGWQFFFQPVGESKMQSSPRRKGEFPFDSPNCVVEFEFASAATMRRLRVDPPAKGEGSLGELRFEGLGVEGQRVELSVLKARDGDWDGEHRRMRLFGKSDPRISLKAPPFPLRALRVSFHPLGVLPEPLLKAAQEHGPLRELLGARGLLEANSGGGQ